MDKTSVVGVHQSFFTDYYSSDFADEHNPSLTSYLVPAYTATLAISCCEWEWGKMKWNGKEER